jgi:hypothetical protein
MITWVFEKIMETPLIFIAYLLLFYIHRKTVNHEAIYNIIKEYRSPEMHRALKQLYDFSQKEGTTEYYEEYLLKDKFKLKYIEEQNKMNGINDFNERSKFEFNTIDHSRRLVSQYYDYLALSLLNRFVPQKYIFSLWSRGDLDIIPKILIPMEWGLKEKYKNRCFRDMEDFLRNSGSPYSLLKMDLYYYANDKSPFHINYRLSKIKRKIMESE